MNRDVAMSEDEERENPLPPLEIATYSTSHGGLRPPGDDDWVPVASLPQLPGTESPERGLERAIHGSEPAGDKNRRILESAAFWSQKSPAAVGGMAGGSLAGITAALAAIAAGTYVIFKEYGG